jgi:hypothetical protein
MMKRKALIVAGGQLASAPTQVSTQENFVKLAKTYRSIAYGKGL